MNGHWWQSGRGGRQRLLLCAALLLSLALGGCQRRGAAGGGDFEITLDPHGSPAVGTLEAIVTLRDRAGAPLDGAAVEVEGNMTHAGMAPTQATATPLGAGRYAVALPLTMGGDWVLTVRAALPDGRAASADILLPGVRGE